MPEASPSRGKLPTNWEFLPINWEFSSDWCEYIYSSRASYLKKIEEVGSAEQKYWMELLGEVNIVLRRDPWDTTPNKK